MTLIKNIITFTFCAFLNCSYLIHAQESCKARIESIPIDDRIHLEEFFRILVADNHFGYTLFGDKPVSLAGYFVNMPIENVLLSGILVDRFCFLLAVWQKYQHLFPSLSFILLDQPQSNSNLRNFLLINKSSFIRVIQENLACFRKILGKDVSPQSLLKALEQSNANLEELCNYHENLLGILLGYGAHNALLYSQRDLILKDRDWLQKIPQDLHKPISKPSVGFNSIEEELLFLWNHLKIEKDFANPLCVILPVQFAKDPSHEQSIKLKKKYNILRKKISLIYQQKDFLEIVLTQLSGKK